MQTHQPCMAQGLHLPFQTPIRQNRHANRHPSSCCTALAQTFPRATGCFEKHSSFSQRTGSLRHTTNCTARCGPAHWALPCSCSRNINCLHISGLNPAVHLPERISLPTASDVQRTFLSDDCYAQLYALSLDFKAAHKCCKVHPDDHRSLCSFGWATHCTITKSAILGHVFQPTGGNAQVV